MGLDSVELVMEIEEEFEIEISNEIAPTLVTVGDLFAFIVQTFEARGISIDDAEIWNRLTRIFEDSFGIPARLIVPEAHIVYDLGLD